MEKETEKISGKTSEKNGSGQLLRAIENPPEEFSFATIFNTLIDNVIKSITNEEGKAYYKQRKQLYRVLNFR